MERQSVSTIYLDSTALSGWSNCREYFRRQQIEKIESVKPSGHYEMGKAVHLAVERFWAGDSFEKALDAAYQVMNAFPVHMLNPAEVDTWDRLVKALPDVVAVYFDSVSYSPEQLLWVEKEWSIPYETSSLGNQVTQVILCGRMDRLMAGPRLVDVKTASEISSAGIPWKQQYRQDKVLDLQFALYDWYLCQMCKCGKQWAHTPAHGHQFESMAPIEIYLEVLLKPYKSKTARYEKIELNELITDSYRKRFAQQLKWKVSEIVHYMENYSGQKPWPLAGGLACSSKYGRCQFLDPCSFGESPKIMAKYKHREPHLELVRIAEGLK
jgi:hypothetical protein